jgi:hypothetical protein
MIVGQIGLTGEEPGFMVEESQRVDVSQGHEDALALPPGVPDRWLSMQEAALLARRSRTHLQIDLGRGRLKGRLTPRRWHTAWEIRLSELHRYVTRIGTGTRGGPRPQKPTELDWERLPTLPLRTD